MIAKQGFRTVVSVLLSRKTSVIIHEDFVGSVGCLTLAIQLSLAPQSQNILLMDSGVDEKSHAKVDREAGGPQVPHEDTRLRSTQLSVDHATGYGTHYMCDSDESDYQESRLNEEMDVACFVELCTEQFILRSV